MNSTKIDELEDLIARGIAPTRVMLTASIANQRLYLWENRECTKVYTISTSEKEPSNVENSFGTPRGLHRIAKKIGDREPLGMVFKGRKPVGQTYWDYLKPPEEKNLITTRILWLEGLEAGVNQGPGVDSFNRYIYIHGTDREHLIGTPISSGCLLLKNNEMLELFNATEEGSLVFIG